MWLKKRTHGFKGIQIGPGSWWPERFISNLILTGLIVASTIMVGCTRPELPAAKVQGVVVDATTFVPLAGVQVRSRDVSTTTDTNGRYQLLVSQGVRELTYSMPDRLPIRKYVVVTEKGEVQLDTLYPASGDVSKGKLVLSRGLAANNNGSDIHRDAGEVHLVSICDELGNQEYFPILGHGGNQIFSPVWAPSGQSFYYSIDGIVAHKEDLAAHGVYRYDIEAKTRTRVWGANQTGVNPQSIAIAPDGKSMVASNPKTIFLLTQLDTGDVQFEPLMDSTSLASYWGFSAPVAWAPSPYIHIPAYLKNVSGSSGQILRTTLQDRQFETIVFFEGNDIINFPLPLVDGTLLFSRRYGTFSPENPGSTWIVQKDGTQAELFGPAPVPIGFDPDTSIFLYIRGTQLHHHNLISGLDLVIVSSVESANRTL